MVFDDEVIVNYVIFFFTIVLIKQQTSDNVHVDILVILFFIDA